MTAAAQGKVSSIELCELNGGKSKAPLIEAMAGVPTSATRPTAVVTSARRGRAR